MRRIVFYGNCQAAALSAAYDRCVAPWSDDEAKFVNAFAPLSEVSRTALATADLVVAQIITGKSKESIAGLPTDAKRLLFPTVACLFLWPFGCQAHPKNRPFWYLRDGPYPAATGDSFLNRLIKQGVDPDEAVGRYLELDVNAVVNLDRLFEMNIEQQKERDAITGYSFSDEIEQKFRDHYMFRNWGHPNLALARHFAREILERIGIDTAARTRIECYAQLFPKDVTPIHPAIISHFALSFLPPEPRYRYLHEGDFTFAEYTRRYMRFEWNEDLMEGIALAQVRRSEEALPKLEAGLVQTPASSVGLRALSGILATRGRLEEAAEVARRATLADPQNADAHGWLSNILLRKQRPFDAEVSARMAVSLAPDMASYHLTLGHALELQARREDALAATGTAVEMEPRNPHALARLGDLRVREGRVEEGESLIRRAMELAPDNPDFHLTLSHALERQGKVDAGITTIGKALELDPGRAQFHHRLGYLLMQARRLDEAQVAIDKAIEIAPETEGFYHTLSHVLERKGQLDAAIAAVCRGSEQIAHDPGGLMVQLGHLLAQSERFGEAEAAFRQAVEFAPQNAGALRGLAEILARQGRIAEAIDVYGHVVRLHPDDAAILRRCGQLLLREGERAEAAEAMLRKSIKLEPNHVDAYAILGDLLVRAGRLKEAELAFERTIELAPDTTVFRDRLDRVRARRAATPEMVEGGSHAEAVPPAPSAPFRRSGLIAAVSRERRQPRRSRRSVDG